MLARLLEALDQEELLALAKRFPGGDGAFNQVLIAAGDVAIRAGNELEVTRGWGITGASSYAAETRRQIRRKETVS